MAALGPLFLFTLILDVKVKSGRGILEWEIVINNKYRDKMGKIVYNMKYEIK